MSNPIYSTVTQFCEQYPAFKPGGVRGLIFNESVNGLKASGAVVRIGRKILIDNSKWMAWVASQNGGAK